MPTAIILSCLTAMRRISSSAAALCASSIASAMAIIALTNKVDSTVRSSVLDLPARRYPQIAPEVQKIGERYGIPYHRGPLLRQFGTVVRKTVKLSLPDSVLGTGRADKPAERVPVAA
jgi:hypothetical protein